MSIARKLVLLVAMALTATALASASAYAQDVSATITPTGAYSGNENGPGTLVSDGTGATITCDTSNFAATVAADAENISVTTLTFGACTASVGGSCTVTVTTLPAPLTGNKDTATAPGTTPARWTLDASTEAATITCGGGVVHCDASVDTTLQGTADSSSPGTWDIVNQAVDIDDLTSIACGTTAVWNTSWTINSPASYTVTQ